MKASRCSCGIVSVAILGVVAFSCGQASATPNGAGETSAPRLTCSLIAHSLGRL
jgi:hypothetical protein